MQDLVSVGTFVADSIQADDTVMYHSMALTTVDTVVKDPTKADDIVVDQVMALTTVHTVLKDSIRANDIVVTKAWHRLAPPVISAAIPVVAILWSSLPTCPESPISTKVQRKNTSSAGWFQGSAWSGIGVGPNRATSWRQRWWVW